MSCPYIPEISYSDFRTRLREKVGRERVPFSGSLELTFRCNNRCQHCYVAHGHTGIPGKQELSYAEVTRILDELVEAGTMWLLLTGGEPLLRTDFAEIYLYAKRKGLLLTLFTNGTLLTPDIVDLLDEYRPFNLEITLYGRSQAVYERVSGVPGSHQRCYAGIQRLLERDIPFRLKTVLMTLNVHEFEEMRAYASSLGVKFRFDSLINAGLDGRGQPLNVRLPAQQVIQIEQEANILGEWQQLYARFENWKHDGRLYQCGAGRGTFHIDPYGQLSACVMARNAAYDLRQGSFQEGWEHSIPQELARLASPEHACRQCRLQPICSACPGWSFVEHGDPQAQVDYLCEVAHRRAAALRICQQPVPIQQSSEIQEVYT